MGTNLPPHPHTFQGMFKDTELSNDVMNAFRVSSHFTEQLPTGIDMGVSVLTSGFWPTYPVADAKLPQVRRGSGRPVRGRRYDMLDLAEGRETWQTC